MSIIICLPISFSFCAMSVFSDGMLRNISSHYYQLGLFSINGEWAYSLFMTNFGHADNSSTFVPCVKSMAAGFDRKIHNFPHGRFAL